MNNSDLASIDLSISGINPYHLVIKLDDKDCFFNIYDHTRITLIASKCVGTVHNASCDDIISLFNDVVESKLLYQSVRIVYESNVYTLVPNDLFRKDHIDDYLNFQFDISSSSILQFSLLTKLNTVVVYAIPLGFERAMCSLFPKITIEHHISDFINDRFTIDVTTQVAVLLRDSYVDILVLVSGKLHLLNTYSVNTPDDLVYYVLRMYEEFSFDIDKVGVYMYQNRKSLDFSKQLNLYIKNVICE